MAKVASTLVGVKKLGAALYTFDTACYKACFQ
jgi:hypothetical protein